MSYLVLARKWRPQTFQDVVAQKNAIQALQNAIKLKRLPHALLLCGSRGIGKTTIARLVAKTINCQQHDPDDENSPAEPCNECSMCKEITEGRATDVIEIDGASNRSIDDIRELRDNVQYLPTRGRRKVYIIDEVHMLTREAFNALLKTLEEPPPHVLFTFATTEPHKIPITILSRCQRFDLKRITLSETCDYLRTLAEREGLQLSDTALMMIARAADGGMRDALSLMDQVVAFGGEAPTDEETAQAIGAIDRAMLFNICSALLQRNIAAALQAVSELFSFAYDLRQLTQELASFLRDLMVAAVCPHPAEVIDLPATELQAIEALAKDEAPDRIQQMFRILTTAAEDIAQASHPRLLLEMTLIQMARVEPVRPFDDIIQQLHLLEDRLAAGIDDPEPSGGTSNTPQGHTPQSNTPGSASPPSGGAQSAAPRQASPATSSATSPAPAAPSSPSFGGASVASASMSGTQTNSPPVGSASVGSASVGSASMGSASVGGAVAQQAPSPPPKAPTPPAPSRASSTNPLAAARAVMEARIQQNAGASGSSSYKNGEASQHGAPSHGDFGHSQATSHDTASSHGAQDPGKAASFAPEVAPKASALKTSDPVAPASRDEFVAREAAAPKVAKTPPPGSTGTNGVARSHEASPSLQAANPVVAASASSLSNTNGSAPKATPFASSSQLDDSVLAQRGVLPPDVWRGLVDKVKEARRILSGPLETARYVATKPGEITLLYRHDQGMLHDTISKDENRKLAEQIFAEEGTPLALTIKIQSEGVPELPSEEISLHERRQLLHDLLIERLKKEAAAHPRMELLLQLMPGTALIRIEPLAEEDASTDNAD